MTGWTASAARQNSEALKNWHERVWVPGEEERRRQKAKQKTSPRRPANANGASRDERYALTALAGEAEKVATTPPSGNGDNEGRNDQLNRSAFATGQLVGGGLLERERAERELREAARQSGLEDREIESTLRSGMEAGMAEPRTRPAGKEEAAAAQVEAVSGNGQAHEEYVQPTGPLPFPVHCFPEPLTRYAQEVATSLSCPVDFPAVTMLVVAATAIGASRALSVTRKWLECPRLYLAIVAVPGSAKSPAVEMVCEPLHERQSLLHAEWEKKKEEYDEELAVWESARRRKAKDGDPPIRKPVRPVYQHLYTTDPTTESLVPMLTENPRGFALIRDEITGWVMSMDQYRAGKGADRQFWLSAWSGQAVKTDRKGQRHEGSLIARHPLLNVLGGIQPDMLGQLCDERGREDGFVHRILFSFPTDHPWSEYIGAAPSEFAEQCWSVVLDELWNLQMLETDHGALRPMIVRMAPDAEDAACQWYAEHAAEANDEDLDPALSGPWSKMRSYFFRLALVFHCLRQACGEDEGQTVSLASVASAAAVTDYFKSHSRLVYSRLHARAEDRLAERVVAWLRRKGKQECCARDLIAAHFVQKASDALALMKDLSDRCLGKIESRQVGQNKQKADYFILDVNT